MAWIILLIYVNTVFHIDPLVFFSLIIQQPSHKSTPLGRNHALCVTETERYSSNTTLFFFAVDECSPDNYIVMSGSQPR